jgi:tyrosine-protein kinase
VDVADGQSVDIGRSLRILWANLWIVLLVVAAAAGGTYLWASGQTKVYQAKALVRAFDSSASSGASSNAKADPARAVDIQVLYARSQDVRSLFQTRMGRQMKKVESTTISSVGDADAISVVVEATSPAVAQAGAQTYAQAYIERQRAALARLFGAQAAGFRTRATDVQKQVKALDAQISALQPTEGNRVDLRNGKPVVIPATERVRNLSLQRNALGQKYADLLDQADQADASGAAQQANVDFVQRPALPRHAESPKPGLDALVAGLIGLLIAIGVVILRNRLRGRMVTTDDVKTVAPTVAFVGAVPPNGSRGRRSDTSRLDAVSTGDGRLAEAYGSMAAWLRLARTTRTARSQIVLVTSALAAEGKTTASTNLAVSLALAGEQVVLVDCDLRHPNVHLNFQLPNDVGYSSVVLGKTKLQRTVKTVSFEGGTLDVLTAGEFANSPAQLLVSREADQLWAGLRLRYDYVIVDSSPVLPVADALTLSRSVDQVLVVVRAGRTRIADFGKAVELLRHFDAPIGGAALIGAHHESANSSYAYPLNPKPTRSGRRKHGAPSRRDRGRDDGPETAAAEQAPAATPPALSGAAPIVPRQVSLVQPPPTASSTPPSSPPPPSSPTEHTNGNVEHSPASAPTNTSA